MLEQFHHLEIQLQAYTAATLVANAFDVTTTNDYYIIVVALDADGNVLAAKQVQAVVA